MTHSAPAPFDFLTPLVVAEAAESIGLQPSGRLFALNSYENRVYQLGDEDGALWVLKFYRPARWSDAQIAEEHSFTFELAGAELPVAAPLVRDGESLFVHRRLRFAAFPYLGGRAPELDDRATLTLLGRTLARMHAIGGRTRFAHRPGTHARAVRQPGKRTGDRKRLCTRVADRTICARQCTGDRTSPTVFRRLRTPAGVADPRRLPCRQHPVARTGPLFVDLDDCMSGPRIQDLWMFLSGDAASQQASWAALMEGYELFGEFDYAELTLVESLRSLRILHHAAWIAPRWHDPAFPRAFPWFADARFWERHISDLLEQLAAMDDPPILAR